MNAQQHNLLHQLTGTLLGAVVRLISRNEEENSKNLVEVKDKFTKPFQELDEAKRIDGGALLYHHTRTVFLLVADYLDGKANFVCKQMNVMQKALLLTTTEHLFKLACGLKGEREEALGLDAVTDALNKSRENISTITYLRSYAKRLRQLFNAEGAEATMTDNCDEQTRLKEQLSAAQSKTKSLFALLPSQKDTVIRERLARVLARVVGDVMESITFLCDRPFMFAHNTVNRLCDIIDNETKTKKETQIVLEVFDGLIQGSLNLIKLNNPKDKILAKTFTNKDGSKTTATEKFNGMWKDIRVVVAVITRKLDKMTTEQTMMLTAFLQEPTLEKAVALTMNLLTTGRHKIQQFIDGGASMTDNCDEQAKREAQTAMTIDEHGLTVRDCLSGLIGNTMGSFAFLSGDCMAASAARVAGIAGQVGDFTKSTAQVSIGVFDSLIQEGLRTAKENKIKPDEEPTGSFKESDGSATTVVDKFKELFEDIRVAVAITTCDVANASPEQTEMLQDFTKKPTREKAFALTLSLLQTGRQALVQFSENGFKFPKSKTTLKQELETLSQAKQALLASLCEAASGYEGKAAVEHLIFAATNTPGYLQLVMRIAMLAISEHNKK